MDVCSVGYAVYVAIYVPKSSFSRAFTWIDVAQSFDFGRYFLVFSELQFFSQFQHIL